MSDQDLDRPYLQAINELCDARLAEIVQLNARIADLEAAGRKLGAEVWWWNYYHSDHDEICAAKVARQKDPTAAGFVKEAGDGH